MTRTKFPKISIDILIIKEGKILLGLLTNKWSYKGKQVYGVPGRDIRFGETIGETVKRDIEEDLGCNVITYKTFCVNANYAISNHYIGIGILAEIDDEPKNLKSEDWEKWEWFDTNNIPGNLFPAAKNVIKSYLENRISVSE